MITIKVDESKDMIVFGGPIDKWIPYRELPESDKWYLEKKFSNPLDAQFIDRLGYSITLLNDSVSVDRDIVGGMPVLFGTRFSIAQVFAEIADGDSLDTLSDRMDLDIESLKKLFEGMSIHLDRPYL